METSEQVTESQIKGFNASVPHFWDAGLLRNENINSTRVPN